MCRQRLNQPRAFGPWLYRIATNTANDWLRRQRLERQYHTSWELREEQEDASDFINVVMQRDLVHKVLQLMPLMPRQCLILYDEQGFSYAEIAILLGGILKESSIRTYVSTARALFRSLYLSFKTSENSLESEGDPYGKM
jgi:RNA polymerase sigma-70 factor (ECF subfamily)